MDLGFADRQDAGRPPVLWVCAPAIMAFLSSADGGRWFIDGGGAAMEKEGWGTKDGTGGGECGASLYKLYPKHKGRGGQELALLYDTFRSVTIQCYIESFKIPY